MVDSGPSSSGEVEEPSTSDGPPTQRSGADNTKSTEPYAETPVQPAVISSGLLGVYRLEAKLGEGGMGAVYKAVHTKLGKAVAVKLLPQRLTQHKESVARFQREMLAVGRISHPNIVQAHDAGEIQGTHYLAMEYVEGTDLQQYVKQRGPMSVVNACKAVRQAALALAAAHAQGLIHRDIKPSNMLLAKDSGQIKLLDLGLARLVDEAAPLPELTVAGETFGTPDYMAPEQWMNSHTVDSRTDLYALGCTLFYLLVGRPPYGDDRHRNQYTKLAGHTAEPIPDLAALRAEIPPELAVIYRKLLAKQPNDRFQTAKEVAEALQPFATKKTTAPQTVVDPLPVIVTDISPPRKAPPKKSLIGLFGGTAGFLLLAGIVIIITNKDGTKTKVEVPAGTQKVEVTKDGKTVATVTPAQAPPQTLEEVFDRNRVAAQRALDLGGEVHVLTIRPQELLIVKAGETLPEGPFVVRLWSLKTSTSATGQDLEVLAGLRHLWRVAPMPLPTGFDSTDIGHLAAILSPLQDLGIGHTTVRTSDLDRLPTWPHLQTLWLTTDQVDDGWKFLRRFPMLRIISLTPNGTGTLPDVRPLAEYPRLRRLRLDTTEPIDPQVVAELQRKNPHLSILWGNQPNQQLLGQDPVRGAVQRFLEAGIPILAYDQQGTLQKLSAESVQEFVPSNDTWYCEAIPEGVILDEELRALLTDVDLYQFTAKNHSQADELAAVLADQHTLYALWISGSDLTDTGLAALRNLAGLFALDVTGTRVTADGVNAFHRAVPACNIASDHGTFSPDFLAVPERPPGLSRKPVDPPVTPTEQRLKFFMQQREVAEFVLSRGGNFYVEWEDDFDGVKQKKIHFKPGMEIPAGAFIIRSMEVGDLVLTGSELAKLTPARRANFLQLANAKLAETDAIQLGEFRNIYMFGLQGSTLKTSWFPELTAPHAIGVTTEMVDDQWAFLSRCPNLRHLLICEGATAIPDLLPLGKQAQLRWLELRDHDVAPDVVEKLQQDNPFLLITTKGRLAGRDPVADAARKLLDRAVSIYTMGMLFDANPKEQPLTIQLLERGGPWRITDIRFDDQHPATVDDVQELTIFAGLLHNVILYRQRKSDQLAQALAELGYLYSLTFDESDLTDAGLAALQRFDKLRYLNVSGNPQITKAGVDAFHQAVPACKILNDHGEILPDIAAVPKLPESKAAP